MDTMPAEWRSDPFGRAEQRYWDGTAWTARIRTGNDESVDPLGSTTTIPFVTPAQPSRWHRFTARLKRIFQRRRH